MTKTRDTLAAGSCIGDRYQIESLIGQGGMAQVYRTQDLRLGAPVALKLLTLEPQQRERSTGRALFEREFHTLTQLRHPHVIAVHDYGLTPERAPYYTMELLDGGDLSERAPLAWRDACKLAFEVCSALALVHSRRLVHRDISPRNIRCTLDGRAKLIDFGAMAPMSAGGTEVVGTPAFTAPETLRRLALDARTDLYSLGATLYFALTRRLPYAARSFSELTAAWSGSVVPPSAIVAGVPSALDDVVLALINPEPELRPQAAFDVMQLLAACAGLDADESDAVSRAYLVTPSLVGRAERLASVRDRLTHLRRSTGILIAGDPGVGRSRFLDACSLEAQALGVTVLRAMASGSHAAFGTAYALAKHLLEAQPSTADTSLSDLFVTEEGRPTLVSFSDSSRDKSRLRAALCSWLQDVSRANPLLIVVDDAQRLDPESAALLAALLDQGRLGRICIALTADSSEVANEVLSVFARRCHRMTLDPLSATETHQLLGSLFGEVAHLQMLSDEIYQITRGNPRQTIELAQWFVDRGVLRYAAGTWTLPSRLSASDLPSSAGTALLARIATLSLNARFLAEAHALAYYEQLSDQDYHALLPELGSRDVEQALNELLWIGAVRFDGAIYTLTNRVWSSAFLAELTAPETERRHRALAAMYEPRSTIATIHHAFAGGLHELGLKTMLRQHTEYLGDYDHKQLLELNVGKMMWCAPLAVATAERLGYSAREIHDLRRWHFAGNITTESGQYDESARCWFEQLAHDSGLALYRADQQSPDAGSRLMRALQTAQERYLKLPERERVYSVEEAIRLLGEYVVVAIALGARTQDATLLRGLPAVLEPFVPLSPVLDVLWKNALATMYSQCECKYEVAHELWTGVLAKLETMTATEFKHVVALRNAVVFALALMETHLGLASAASWAERLDHDPYQRISALHLRKIARLEQGDQRGADSLRRQSEVLSLQMRSPQMFRSLLLLELAACVRARDLPGIRHVREEMQALAHQYVGWVPSLILSEASFHLISGDVDAAKLKFTACRDLCNPDTAGQSRNLAMWIASSQGLADTLLQTGRADEAREVASRALSLCTQTGIAAIATDLDRALGLIEAKLGDAHGCARIESQIAHQQQLGMTGIRMGLSFEARAQIAIWSADRPAFEHFAALTAREYRHGAGNPLAARYARLLNEAARRGWQPQAALARLENFDTSDQESMASSDLLTRITRTLATKRDGSERSDGVLDLICAELGCDSGHLYLFTKQGFAWSASRGEKADDALYTHVAAWVEEQRARAEAMDDMDTGELTASEESPVTLHLGQARYQMQALRCVVAGTQILVGVAATLARARSAGNQRHAQLLNLLAEHLLQAEDSEGLRFA